MKKIIIFFLLLFIDIPLYGEFVDSGGDFSNRSLIIKQITKRDSLSQEQKDILSSRRLFLSPICLIEQIENDKIENVKILLEFGLNPNMRYYTMSPLYVASKKNNFEIMQLLVEHGAKTDKSFESELFNALKHKNAQMAMYLIEHGAKVNYISEIGQKSVLYISLKNKMYDISEILIKKGAPLDRRSVLYIKKHKLLELIPDKYK